MQNIASFFAKCNPHPPSQQNSSPNEQISTPHHTSEQHTSPTHSSPQISPQRSPHNSTHNSPQNSTHNSPQNEVEHSSPLNASGDGVRLSENDLANLPHDPGLRKKMSDFHPDDRDLVRITYIQKGPCQPKNHDENAFGGDAFVTDGFRSWNRLDILKAHVGKHMSAHNNAVLAIDLFKKQKSSITTAFSKQSKESMSNYRKRLEASIISVQWLLVGALPFRAHDEKETSSNRGNFLRLLTLVSELHPDYSKVCLKNAPGNCQLTSPVVQKDIINACAKETTKATLEDLNGGFFAILADESADIYDKEQMALCLRYVNKKGEVCERLLGIVHVGDTTSLTLKAAIESLLIQHSLSFSQLTQVALARKNPDCAWLFSDMLAPLLNFLGCSPKRKEFLCEKQAQAVVDALSLGELETGSGLNQERGLGRPCDTRWGSHFKTLVNVLDIFPSILGSLDDIAKAAEAKSMAYYFNKAQSIIGWLMTFDFVFVAHLMVTIFAITNELNVALQKHDQDIVNAMAMVNVTKANLQELRDERWDSFMEKILSFTTKYEIEVPDMNATYVVPGRRMFRDRDDERFWNLKSRSELSKKLVETGLSETHSRVYLLLKLVLVLPIATASVERVFSGMTIVKDKLRNSMGDQMLNDCLITFLESDLFSNVKIDHIIDRYQNMKTRREQL
ncbi:zinc finger MYM-type protein 1-like [Chenopodium quinoa]|uniref:zinc finger MYM-type protein 1-like n=1 Tax=Chenopodium quinoa TaxID=63459 RepID=UPI000B79118A|nr:zinc finger MYM-type protein 1-like [Chenopodium quinoa]